MNTSRKEAQMEKQVETETWRTHKYSTDRTDI